MWMPPVALKAITLLMIDTPGTKPAGVPANKGAGEPGKAKLVG